MFALVLFWCCLPADTGVMYAGELADVSDATLIGIGFNAIQVGFSPLFLRSLTPVLMGKCRKCPFFRAFY
jgi:hypothetical protein